ncbi:MAG: hypothetical protein JO058_00970 [Alphaproteobacteria bacterium]|nr:hypothetical protein [Alphaproteobacteria bacterium]MBV9152496.1 hypothetical protein [Alphaproteobacteria bacterium]
MDEQAYQQALALRDRLREELRQNTTYRALELSEAIVALWAARTASNGEPAQEPPPAAQIRATPRRHYAGSKTAKIVEGAKDYLRSKGARAQTTELYRALQARGIEVGGKDPLKTTASYLSHSGEFNNVPGQGYGLKEWPSAAQPSKPQAEPATEAAAPCNGAPKVSPLLSGVSRFAIMPPREINMP